MNKFKKFMSAAIAAATLLAGTAFPVSATDYDPYDVNRDGRVSPADVVQLSKLYTAVMLIQIIICVM